jgi:uncharacterized peroxidase-related enzyme
MLPSLPSRARREGARITWSWSRRLHLAGKRRSSSQKRSPNTFIETVPGADAPEAVAELYELDRATFGHVPNFTKAFSLRPDVYSAWRQLNAAIKAGMDLRRYELATVAAALHLRSSYCMLAHGSVLAEQFLEPDTVRAVVADHRTAGLEPVDVAVMDLAQKVADDATTVTQADIDRVRSLGLSDTEVLEVVVAAAARCFFSKVLDGLGARPDQHFTNLEPSLRDALTVGRPIADG